MIEAWIRAADPDAPSHASVQQHIASCTPCQEVERFLRSIHAALAAERIEPGSKVLGFAARLAPHAAIIRLTSFHENEWNAEERTSPVILAARTTSKGARFQPLATLASPDGMSLLRIVLDAGEDICHIYLRTQVEGPAFIQIPAWNLNVVTDDEGHSQVSMHPFAGEPVPVEAEVALFQGALDLRIDLVKAHVQTIGTTGDVSQIHCRLIGRELELSLLNRLPAQSLCRASVAINGAAPLPMVIGPQNALIPLEGTEISMRVCLYA
jgi:hypothetical protein